VKRIPKTFQLYGHKITVRLVSKRDWEEYTERFEEIDDEDVGYFFPEDNLILIRRQGRTQDLHCFFHELMHAIYYYMHIPFPHNEQHVDQAGGLLAQAMDTAE
jgi:hypothetical protein